MDGRSRRFSRSTQREPAFQLKPQPRYIVSPSLPGVAVNGIKPIVRPIPAPLPAVQAIPTLTLPQLGLAGLAYGLGFFIGDALINPLLGQQSVFDWGLWNSPAGAPGWQWQDALPESMTVTSVGEMGTDGANVTASMVYGDSRIEGSTGCHEPIDRDIEVQYRRTVTNTGGQLKYSIGVPAPNGCGVLSMGVAVLIKAPNEGKEPDFETVTGRNASGFRPPGGITYGDFEVQFEPLGEPLGFIPTPLWEPIVQPKPQVEPLPQPEPQPEPERKPVLPPVIPMAPPNVRPIPEPGVVPGPNPSPAPAPAPLPSTVPNPRPTPPPTIPNTLTRPINIQGNIVPQPQPLPQPTPNNLHFPVPGGPPISTAGMRNSLNAIAAETARIEQKSANIQNEVGSILDNLGDLADLIELMEFIKGLFEKPYPEEEYVLNPVCEDEAEPTVVSIPEEMWADRLITYQTVVPQLLQAHLGYKTPTCRTRPQLQGDWRTISFISDETSPHGRNRLRKRLRYRSLSGLGLGEVIDHWANFTWEAGPVCVQHSGASWGTPQVWASTVDEGKRVIRHAAGESGLDPDQVGQWTVSGSRSPRVGVSGTMRVNQTGGFYWITARDGSEGRPTVGTV